MRVGGKVHGVVLSVPVRSRAARAALRGTSPLPHLLQRGHACGRGVVSLGAWLETGDAAAMPTQKSSQPTKTGNHGLTGSARCNKCGSGLVPRSAARSHRRSWCCGEHLAALTRSFSKKPKLLKTKVDLLKTRPIMRTTPTR